MLHTFEMTHELSASEYMDIKRKLQGLHSDSHGNLKTFFYKDLGFTTIKLLKIRNSNRSKHLNLYYLKILCNMNVLLDGNHILVVDDYEYSKSEVIERISSKLKNVSAFDTCNLPLTCFFPKRVDMAIDIQVERPEVLALLSNLSMPFKMHKLDSKYIWKHDSERLNQSCYFKNNSRTFNLYSKYIECIDNGTVIPPVDEERIKHTFRLEIQLKKRGINYLSNKDGDRSIVKFFDGKYCREQIINHLSGVFTDLPYVSERKADTIIKSSSFNEFEKAVMKSIVRSIHIYGGLYNLEKAIIEKNRDIPIQYGTIKTFRYKWLKKIRSLGINPVTIPDYLGVDDMPSFLNLIKERKIQYDE